MKSNKMLCLGIIMVMILSMAGLTAAIERDYVYVSTALAHESDPDVYGRYVVWRVGMDDVSVNGNCDFGEASWIVLHNTITGETKNITKTWYEGFRSGSYYWHARDAHVYGTKVIYLDVTGGNDEQKTIMVYDILTEITTECDYYLYLSSIRYTDIQNIDMYEDWISINVEVSGVNWLYAYNTVTNIPKVISIHDTTHDVKGVPIIDDNKIYYTEWAVGDLYSLSVYDLIEGSIDKVTTSTGIDYIRSYGADYGYMGFIFNNYTGEYPAVLDTQFINITDITKYTGFPPTRIHDYNDDYIQENITILNDDITYTYSNILVTRHEIIYNANIGNAYKILVHDMKYNKSYTLLNSNYAHVLSDVWEDVLVWETNENSLTPGTYTDFRINTDIYRTITEIEAASNSIGAFIPVAIIIMFVGAMFMIIRQFSGGGESF